MPGSSPLPEALSVAIGGPLGPSYWVDWDAAAGALRYRAHEQGEPEEVLVVPDAGAWGRFWAALDSIAVWGWAARHEDPSALDGTGWHLEIAHAGRRVVSSGSNAYPGAGGPGDPGPQFLRLCAEVSALAGGRRFR